MPLGGAVYRHQGIDALDEDCICHA